MMRFPHSRLLVGAVALALLGGCSLAPTYHRPEAPVEAGWAGSTTSGNEIDVPMLRWQEFVHDAQLREVIALALGGNRDLRVAVQNIEVARAQYRIRRADQVPSVGVSASGQRGTTTSGSGVAESWTAGLGIAAWELDFFGRVAALKDVALAQFLASEENRKAAQISLIANVAETWLRLKTDTELLALAERTAATRDASLELMQLRADNGASSALDVLQAKSLAASAHATLAHQQRLRTQDVNLLNLLAGQTVPEHLLPALPPFDAVAMGDSAVLAKVVPPVADLPSFEPVPDGLDSELLLRRPDIRAAEQQLIAANANIGVARANFFPRISLTGNLGRISSQFDDLLGSDGTRVWSVGTNLTAPLFDLGRNRANLAASKASREMAVAQYEKAIQSGFREVADALIARSTYADQLDAQAAQAAAERERFRLSELRYRNGVASYLDLLDAQRSLFAIEQALAQTRLAQRISEVQLYRALGGGWESGEP
ncbi:MAG TPA: efflux transporter outer membrane subunit [Chiayiivirga sp.]|nr:efflux transporter outer membrane subunit [Chiayiivirga sp.]